MALTCEPTQNSVILWTKRVIWITEPYDSLGMITSTPKSYSQDFWNR